MAFRYLVAAVASVGLAAFASAQAPAQQAVPASTTSCCGSVMTVSSCCPTSCCDTGVRARRFGARRMAVNSCCPTTTCCQPTVVAATNCCQPMVAGCNTCTPSYQVRGLMGRRVVMMAPAVAMVPSTTVVMAGSMMPATSAAGVVQASAQETATTTPATPVAATPVNACCGTSMAVAYPSNCCNPCYQSRGRRLFRR